MAGGAQGGRPAQNQGVGTQGAPQVTPQAQQFQQALQNYRQGAVGMPSQVPGANMAAPGGGMASAAVMPQQQNQNPQVYSAQPAYAGPAMPQAQGSNMASAAVMPQAQGNGEQMRFMQPPPVQTMPQPAPQISQVMPQAPISVGSSQPMPQMDQAQLQQIQAMANNPAYQQALLAAQQATMGGGNAAPTPMPRPMPMPQDPRMQQNPRMTPRVSDMMPRREQMARPQIQGNPNAMPIQRGQGRVR